jgi:hypothetical protein
MKRPAAEWFFSSRRPLMPNTSITVDHKKRLTVSIVVETEHVVVYKLWSRQSSDDAWKVVGDGTTEDDITDAYDLGVMAAGSALACWIGVAGRGKSRYEIQLIFSQGNAVVDGGTTWIEGATDTGGAVEEARVVFP